MRHIGRPVPTEQPHAGWRSRGYLPHFDSPETVQHIVFRLADAFPGPVMDRLDRMPAADRLDGIEAALLVGHGERLLADARLGGLIEDALLHFDVERYRLLAWCVMPTHVHALAEQVEGHRLSSVVQTWKSFTGKAANAALGRRGTFWAREYYDRFMRNERHLEATRAYIESNPVKAGLCRNAGDWRFSSAWAGRSTTT